MLKTANLFVNIESKLWVWRFTLPLSMGSLGDFQTSWSWVFSASLESIFDRYFLVFLLCGKPWSSMGLTQNSLESRTEGKGSAQASPWSLWAASDFSLAVLSVCHRIPVGRWGPGHHRGAHLWQLWGSSLLEEGLGMETRREEPECCSEGAPRCWQLQLPEPGEPRAAQLQPPPHRQNRLREADDQVDPEKL